MVTIEDDKPHSNLASMVWPIIVIALSITAVAILYLTIGHIGPTYSANVMSQQQRRLRQQYNLPAQPIITNPKILQIPPSLRNVPPSVYYSSK